MKFHLKTTSILPMLDFLRKLKNNTADRNMLHEILNHPDYNFEFDRYEIKSKDSVIDYIMRLGSVSEMDIPELDAPRKDMLKHKHKKWLDAYQNPDYYEELYNKVKAVLSDEVLDEACATAKRGLEKDMEIGDINAISTLSVGTSFGYVHQGAFHFDLLGIEEYGGLEMLPHMLSHEIHHIVLMKHVPPFSNSLTLEEQFIQAFAYEGLAIKFCNNAKGVISKPIWDASPVNQGIDSFTMDYLNARFEEACDVFFDTLDKIRSGKMDKDGVMAHFDDYWWNRHTEEQSKDEKALLDQSLFYSFGNDLYGSIYDVYGAEVLFDCVRNPLKTVEYFGVIAKRGTA